MIYVISIIAIIVLLELLIRKVINTTEKRKQLENRKEVLEKSLEQDFSAISNTLKRVELQDPKARLLVVDKDEQVLTKLRSMLVLDGYSVDTVSGGKEAAQLTLLNHYDFVFTGETTKDLSGEELTKKVLERRPDMNVIVMTEGVGASTPYDLIREGAIDFIQKPYVDSRLNDFVRTQLEQRREKIKAELDKSVRYIKVGEHIPNGYFLTKNHIWAYIEENGVVRLGIDSFASDFLGVIDTVDFANLNIIVSKENPIFIVKKNFRDIPFISPFEGRIVGANVKIRENFSALHDDPYKNWICKIEPYNLDEFVKTMMIGSAANDFITDEKVKLATTCKQLNIKLDENGKHLAEINLENWKTILDTFFAK